jgi:beta-lactamase regulating signal transducer with metallopeptidase domain
VDAVLNWLWQGGMVAIVAGGTLHLLDRARAAVRCLVCWAALLVVGVLPLISLAMAAASPVAPAASNAAAILTVPAAWWTSSALIAGAWAIWTTIYGIRLARAIVVVRRARAQCRPFSPAVESSLGYWRRARHTGRPARLVLSDRLSAAAVFGCGRPVIAVAPTLIARLDADELDRVVIHEWAHVQRRDDLANIGQLLIRALAGWHPAIWWLDRRLSVEQELACDETVVAVTGGAKSYASCLVKLASLRSADSDVMLASGALSSSGLTRRVARLLLFKDFISSAWGRRAAALAAMLLVVLALGVARLRIVEAAVSATVVRVLQPVASAIPAAVHPVAMRSSSPPALPQRRATATVATAAPEHLGTAQLPVPATPPPAPERETEALDETSSHGNAGAAADAAVEPSGPPLVTLPSPAPAASPPASDADSRSTWGSPADAGVAIGRGTKKAGVATAGAFTRFAKKIAGSF